MPYKGEQSSPLTLTAASQLERYRVVTLTGQVPAYAAPGGACDGVVSARGDAVSFDVPVLILDGVQKTFFCEAGAAITADALVFPTTNGKIVGSKGAIANRSEQDQPSVDGTYIVPAAGWSTGTGTAHQVGVRSTTWTFTTPSTGDVYYLTQEDKYVTFNGTIWVDATPLGKAMQDASADGSVISVYSFADYSEISRSNLPTELNSAAKIVLSVLTDSETDADATVTHLDARIAATDVCVAILKAAANAVYVTKAVCTAGTCTITLSGNGGAGTVVNLTVFKSLDS